MSKFLKTASALALAFGLQGAHADTLLLDDFTVSQSLSVAGGATGGNVAFDTSVGCVNILGCYRDVFIDATGSATAVSAVTVQRTNAQTPLVGGGFELTTNVGSQDFAQFRLTWDGDNNQGNNSTRGTGSLNANLSAYFPAGGLEFLVSSDGGLSGSQQVSIALYDGDGDVMYTQFTAFNTGFGPDGYVVATFSFGSDFALNPLGTGVTPGNGAFDWSNVDRVQGIVDVNGDTKSLDFSIRAVQFVVPEPASLALVGLSLIGIGIARRRKS